jgi:hypothetical protein
LADGSSARPIVASNCRYVNIKCSSALDVNCAHLLLVAGSGTTYVLPKVKPEDKWFISQLYPWITAYFSLTLITTVLCTGMVYTDPHLFLQLIWLSTALIATRIWRCQRALKKVQLRSNLIPAMIVVIESGATYAAAMLSVLIAYVTKSNGQCIVLDLVGRLWFAILSSL